MKIQDRESNIELLRLVLMFMIVVVHFLGHNILSATNLITSDNPHFYTSNLLQSFVVCAVDCFVLISGWFSIRFSVAKLIMFLLPICLYQLLISFIYYPFGAKISVNPFDYWFVAPYVALMVMSPILNKGLEMVDKRHLLTILICLTIVFILPLDSLSGMRGKNIFVFMYIYCLGFYLKKYYSNKYSVSINLGCFALVAFLIFLETVVLEKMGRFEGTKTLSYSYDNVLIVLDAVFLFLAFSKMKFKSKVVNKLSLSAFYVYIITENTNCWSHKTHSIYKLLNVSGWENSAYYILMILGWAIGVFILALLIDLIRRICLAKPMQILNEKLHILEKNISPKTLFKKTA